MLISPFQEFVPLCLWGHLPALSLRDVGPTSLKMIQILIYFFKLKLTQTTELLQYDSFWLHITSMFLLKPGLNLATWGQYEHQHFKHWTLSLAFNHLQPLFGPQRCQLNLELDWVTICGSSEFDFELDGRHSKCIYCSSRHFINCTH